MEELRKVKTAIVGCGMISTIYCKNLVNLFSIIDVVAVCDMNEEAAKTRAEQFQIPQILTLDEVCASDEIELAVNLTGPSAHYDVIKKLLLAGKHVYTEKLLCFDLEEGKELVQIAEEKHLYLGVAPDTFLGAGLQTARKMIDNGFIGRPTSCQAAINRNQPLNSEKFGYIRYNGGSFPYDVGVYYITALLGLLGPVKQIAGFTAPAPAHQGRLIWNGNYGKEWELEGSNVQGGSLLFENGVIGSILFDGTSIDEEHPHLVIYGTEGILYLGDPNRYDGEVKLVRSGEGSAVIPFTHGFKGTPLYGEPTPFDWGGHRGVGVAEMAWSMRLGRTPRASKEMGLHTLELLTGLDVASEKGCTYTMTSTFDQPRPLPTGYPMEELGGFLRADAEMALTF